MSRYEHLRNKPKPTRPTRKQERLYRQWRQYLKDSRLTESEQHARASQYADSGREPKP